MAGWGEWDEEFVKRCLAGEEEAIKFLYEELKKGISPISRIIYHPGFGFGDEAEDVFQEVFFARLLPGLKEFKPPQTGMVRAFQAYLIKICRNACISVYRARRALKSAPRTPFLSWDEALDQLIGDFKTPEEVYRSEQLREKLYQALKLLDERCREILRMRLSEYTIAEIADKLGEKPKTTETAFYRCLARFKKIFLSLIQPK